MLQVKAMRYEAHRLCDEVLRIRIACDDISILVREYCEQHSDGMESQALCRSNVISAYMR